MRLTGLLGEQLQKKIPCCGTKKVNKNIILTKLNGIRQRLFFRQTWRILSLHLQELIKNKGLLLKYTI